MTVHGILPVWKEPRFTSHDVVAAVRRLAKQKKVGHTGTLDPSAEGVLPLCLGKATRVAEYVQDLPKMYEGTLTLGIATDTEDQEGKTISQAEVDVSAVTRERLHDVFQQFTGEIEQVPPMYSAVKVKGRRLYEYARAGKEVARRPRRVYIYSLELLEIEYGKRPRIGFRVKCSKGTYIRTLCVDIGQALGYPAHMSALTRVASGSFTRKHCATLAELRTSSVKEWMHKWLYPLDAGLTQFPSLDITPGLRARVLNGRPLRLTEGRYTPGTLMRVYARGEFLALYRANATGQQAVPVKVFAENR